MLLVDDKGHDKGWNVTFDHACPREANAAPVISDQFEPIGVSHERFYDRLQCLIDGSVASKGLNILGELLALDN